MSAEYVTAPINFEPDDLRRPPSGMLEFVTRTNAGPGGSTSAGQSPEHDRRQVRRYHIAAEVPAVVIDTDDAVLGTPFMLVTRNVSTRGISLVHTQDLTGQRLAVELAGAQGERIQVALEVVRCTPLGDYFELGCRYVRKLT